LLPLRDVVVYPHMVIPLFVGREKSIRALEKAMESNKQILLAAQTNAATDDPGLDDIHKVATLANILQLLKLPDGTVKVLVEGAERARLVNFLGSDDYFQAQFTVLVPEPIDEREAEVMTRSVLAQFEQYVKLNNKIPPEILSSLEQAEDDVPHVGRGLRGEELHRNPD